MKKTGLIFLLLLIILGATACSKAEPDNEKDLQNNQAIWEEIGTDEARGYEKALENQDDAQYLNTDVDKWIKDGKLITDYSQLANPEEGKKYIISMYMPPEVAQKATSKELVDFSLSNKAIITFAAFDGDGTWKQGFEELLYSVNTFDYLFERDDFASAVYDAYISRDVNLEKDDRQALCIDSVLEIILAQDCVCEKLDDNQRKSVVEQKDSMKKYRMGNEIQIYSSYSLFGEAVGINSEWDKYL